MNHKTNVIRETAYHLWEREGRPHGRQLEHWLEAEAIVGTGMLGPKDAPPARKRTSTKRAPAKKAVKRTGASSSAKTESKKSPSKSKAKTTKKTTTRGRKKT